MVFLISLEDISTDALSVKELRNNEITSFLQCTMQPIGGVLGSLVMLELVTNSMSDQLGLTEPILTVPQFLTAISFLILAIAIGIHFLYE